MSHSLLWHGLGFAVVTGGRGAGEVIEDGACVFVRVMTSLSMHASIFSCVDFMAASHC